MRIGIDCRLFSTSFTGIGRYTHELVENYIRLNAGLNPPHQLILFFNNPEFKSFKTARHVQKILVNAKHYSLAEQFVFLNKLNRANLDLVHFPHFNVPVLYNKPYIITIHDLTLSMFPGQKMTRWHHRAGYNITIKNAIKKAQKIIAVSENTKKDLLKILHANDAKITVIHNGLSPEFKAMRKYKIVKNSSVNPPFLLYTGVWRSHKNLPRLIEAFKLLKTKKFTQLPLKHHPLKHHPLKHHPLKHHPLNNRPLNHRPPDLKLLKLIITGNPDSHYPEVKNTVKKLHLQKDVLFPGLIPEKQLIRLYNQASIFVFPSLYEGFGLPPLEAMACGAPVAASKASSITEICGLKNAIFFDPYDTTDMAKKLYLLYANMALRKKLIQNGLTHSRKFSWKNTARKTFRILLACLKKKP